MIWKRMAQKLGTCTPFARIKPQKSLTTSVTVQENLQFYYHLKQRFR